MNYSNSLASSLHSEAPGRVWTDFSRRQASTILSFSWVIACGGGQDFVGMHNVGYMLACHVVLTHVLKNQEHIKAMIHILLYIYSFMIMEP